MSPRRALLDRRGACALLGGDTPLRQELARDYEARGDALAIIRLLARPEVPKACPEGAFVGRGRLRSDPLRARATVLKSVLSYAEQPKKGSHHD